MNHETILQHSQWRNTSTIVLRFSYNEMYWIGYGHKLRVPLIYKLANASTLIFAFSLKMKLKDAYLSSQICSSWPGVQVAKVLLLLFFCFLTWKVRLLAFLRWNDFRCCRLWAGSQFGQTCSSWRRCPLLSATAPEICHWVTALNSESVGASRLLLLRWCNRTGRRLSHVRSCTISSVTTYYTTDSVIKDRAPGPQVLDVK